MNNLNIVKKYFELSNNGNLKDIKKMLGDDVVYSSENVGVHFGKNNVMNMKKEFFSKFQSITWDVLKMEEIKENIFQIDFVLNAILETGESLNKNGKETIIIKDEKILFIEVKNK